MDSNLNSPINEDTKFEFNIEQSYENNINQELEIKWKEIEEMTQQKINKNKESRKLNKLNNFSIMRINLKSLIHPIDDSSDFENYCNLKIKQLDKALNSLESNKDYNSNLITLITNNNRKYNNDNNIKSFLKSDDEDELDSYKYKTKFTLNELINNNKTKKSKRKIDISKLFDNNLSNNEDNYNNNNKTFSYNIKNKIDYEDTYDKKIDKFANKLNEIKNTFLKKDKNFNTIGNNILSTKEKNKNNINKFDFQNNYNFSGYNTTKNKTINSDSIKNKIQDGYNYLYSLYPNLRKNH